MKVRGFSASAQRWPRALLIGSMVGVLLCPVRGVISIAEAEPESGAAASGDKDAAGRARALYERGMAHFQLAEYDDAIKLWQEGFRIKPVPEFLYNIGQAYRVSQRPDKALQSYRAYLRMAPKAANRVEVERHMTALQKTIDQNERAAQAPPSQPIAPSSPPVSSTATPSTAPPSSATTPTTATASAPPSPSPSTAAARDDSMNARAVTAKAPPARPITKKAWFWATIAGAVVVVAGAVTLGVVLGTRDSVRTLPGLSY